MVGHNPLHASVKPAMLEMLKVCRLEILLAADRSGGKIKRVWMFVGALASIIGSATLGGTSETSRLSGDFGYGSVVIRNITAGSLIDANLAKFHVANSANPDLTANASCDSGDRPVNPYPLTVQDSPAVTLRGGLFDGEISLTTDWEHAYCNSAAVTIRDSPDVVVEAIRARQVWDGIRFSGGSKQFALRRSWISVARDDCVENDFLNAGLIEDVLFDGCFSGVSVRPPDNAVRVAADAALVFNGVLMRMQSFLYKTRIRQGFPIKADAAAQPIQIHDSVIAMDNSNSVSKKSRTIAWQKISECSGNLLLWMSDEPWPTSFERPPECFRLIQGEPARARWQRVRKNWIDCHPSMRRFGDDPVSNRPECDPKEYGGFSQRH